MSHAASRRRAEAGWNCAPRAYTYQEIADTLGYRHRNAALTAVRRLLASTRRPTVAEMGAESAEELRLLRRRLHEQLDAAERDGDSEAVTKITREIRVNLEALARLDGLNAPQWFPLLSGRKTTRPTRPHWDRDQTPHRPHTSRPLIACDPDPLIDRTQPDVCQRFVARAFVRLSPSCQDANEHGGHSSARWTRAPALTWACWTP